MGNTEVDWLLPGCTLEQMRERADRFVPFWKKTDGRLLAKVRERDGRTQLVVRIIRLRRYQRSFTVRADLTQEGTSVRVVGGLPRADIASIVAWVGLLALGGGLAVGALLQRPLLDPLTLLFVAFAAALAWSSRGVVSGAKAGFAQDLAELEGKVRSRFTDRAVPGAPWVAEPAPGTGYQPFKPQPMIRFGRGRKGRTDRTRSR